MLQLPKPEVDIIKLLVLCEPPPKIFTLLSYVTFEKREPVSLTHLYLGIDWSVIKIVAD